MITIPSVFRIESSLEAQVQTSLSSKIDKLIKYGLLALFLCLMLPWEILPYPLFHLNFLDTGAGVFFETRAFLYIAISFLCFLWVLKAYFEHSYSFMKTEVNLPILFFLLVIISSAFRFLNLRGSIDDIFLYLTYFLIFWLVINYFETFKEINLFLNLIIFCTGVLSLYGIYQYLIGFKSVAQFALIEGIKISPDRVFAIFTSPNSLAALILLVFPISYAYLLYEKNRFKRVLFLVSIVLMLTCLFLTFSRGGWLCFLIALGIAFFYYLRDESLRKRAILTFLILLFFTVIFSAVVIQLSAHISAETSTQAVTYVGLEKESAVASASGRFYLWRGSFSLWKEFPISGSGIGTFASVYPKYQFGGIYSKYAHSIFFETLAETGLFSAIILFWIFYLIFRREHYSVVFSKDDELKVFSIALFAGTFGFFLHSLIDINFQVPLLGLVFWALVGISFVFPKACLFQKFSLAKFNFSMFTFFISLSVIFLISFLVFSFYAGYALNNQGKDFVKKGDYESAKKVLEKATLFDPVSAPYRSQLAETYGHLSVKNVDLLENAIFQVEKAVSLEPRWPFYHAQLAVLYWRAGNFEKTQSELKKAHLLYPNDPYFLLLLGKFYLSQDKLDLAVEEFKKAVSLKKLYEVFYPERALASIGESYIELGNVYSRGYGDFKKALSYYDEAIKINPDNLWAHFYKGVTFQALGNFKEAEVEFNKVLEIEPDNQEALSRLKEIQEILRKSKD